MSGSRSRAIYAPGAAWRGSPRARFFPRTRSLATAVAAVSLLLPQSGYAQDPKPTEYEVEAAYLSNFGRFVEWPAKPAPGEAFNVCVLGQDPFGALLDNALKGEAIGNSPMAARRISGAEEASSCRIVFISSAKDAQLPGILTALGAANILTVSDMPAFTRRGGMIQFVIDGNRVRFEINLNAAQRAGLSLSSQLLKLAVTVRRGP
jgi:hypothetical protein